ncbi:drug:h+ antiporter [Irpex rosettiformis]|uniref:Drug:h+ antiporter n=1 Tax=Irpex rosettiformis TaxID=378272 RepID=A0ACB8UF63_9APHY|nr:drug:h+ antiporter [Irpex rosettiformis]
MSRRRGNYVLLATQDTDDREESFDGPDESQLSDDSHDAQLGVKTVEAAQKVYGRYSKWFLFLGLGLASYIYSLDGTTTWTYLAYATSAFGEHSLISSVQVAQSVIIACGKPVIAKLADTTSRGTAYLAVLLFYVIGYIVIASAQSVGAIAAGIILYAVGYTGLQLLTQVIIADITTLKWRGLVSSLMSTPFIINAFVGANISTAILAHAGWRWGYGMFAILIPASLSPLIVTLYWAERKAKRLGLVSNNGHDKSLPILTQIWNFAQNLDIIGLIFLGAAVALILLPLTFSQTASRGWHNGSIIAMLVVGIVLLFVFAGWDIRFATRPVMPGRFLRNRAFVAASWIGFLDFVSFYLTNTYLYSFILVVKPWPLLHATYFSSTQTVALTIFGIMAGGIMTFTRRYKWLLVVGLCIRLLGAGLMIHSRGANSSDAEIVWTQILQGIGGGIAAVSSQVGAQASVTHADVAIVTAVVLLWTEIGGAVGQAIAGAVWTNTMPKNLAKYLPQLSAEEREKLYGSLTTVTTYPRGDPIREGVISAYDRTMRTLVIAATCISVVPILFSLMMPDYHLNDKQNAVDNTNLTGDRVEGEEGVSQERRA